MKGLEKLQEDFNIAKENLKIANDFLVIVSYWNKRKDYTFKSMIGDDVELFGNSYKGTFWDWGKFGFSSYVIKHFLDMYEIGFDKKHKDYTELMKLMKIIKTFEIGLKKDLDRYYKITDLFDKEIKP